MTTGFVLDTGALLAADRAERRWVVLWDHMVRNDIVPVIPAGVVGQSWRGGPRAARMARLLAAAEVVALEDARARAAGELCGKAGTADPIDASVVLAAKSALATVVTSDPEDIRQLADAADVTLPLVTI